MFDPRSEVSVEMWLACASAAFPDAVAVLKAALLNDPAAAANAAVTAPDGFNLVAALATICGSYMRQYGYNRNMDDEQLVDELIDQFLRKEG